MERAYKTLSSERSGRYRLREQVAQIPSTPALPALTHPPQFTRVASWGIPEDWNWRRKQPGLQVNLHNTLVPPEVYGRSTTACKAAFVKDCAVHEVGIKCTWNTRDIFQPKCSTFKRNPSSLSVFFNQGSGEELNPAEHDWVFSRLF